MLRTWMRAALGIAWITCLASPGPTSATPRFGPEQELAGGIPAPQNVWTADLDRDGQIDVVAANALALPDEGPASVTLHRSGGQTPVPSFETLPGTRAPLMIAAAVAADLDGDGDLDVVAAEQFAHRVPWYENQGGSPARPRSSRSISTATSTSTC
ncbi:MAG: FG-GAP-like repeat-containing protein [Proteobacteria bacterium]|nr:FG-GAP-like repeat-containing protein [Pseudomonadota bacterium]